LSRVAIRALKKWIAASGKKRGDYLFTGRGAGDRPMGTRQLSRLVKDWVIEAGLDPSVYSIESLRRAKALHILQGTGDLQTVRALLGHVQIESTARYLGLKTKVDPIEVSRAFDMYDSAQRGSREACKFETVTPVSDSCQVTGRLNGDSVKSGRPPIAAAQRQSKNWRCGPIRDICSGVIGGR
jgi:hypothetical protein